MKKGLKTVGWLLLAAFILYNSVYFKRLKDVKMKASEFNATAYADRFYNKQLLQLSDSAVEISSLIAMLKSNKEEAFSRYGHALSIGSIKYFLIRGEGTVTAVNTNTVAVKLPGDTIDTKLSIATEFVFGNAIRDASGKLSLSDFSNLSDVNNISLELNKMVRTKVLPPFKQNVTAGNHIRFYGAVQLNQERLNLDEIEIIPIQLQLVNQ